MMAFVDDKMTVVRYEVGYFASAHETLDQRDINNASRLAASAANDADVLRIDIEECPQPLHPLGEHLAAMDKNERIASPLRNKGRGHNRLAEGCRRRKHAMVMRTKRFERLDLWLMQ